jgi:hypothetical protein
MPYVAYEEMPRTDYRSIKMEEIVRLLCSPELEKHLTRTDSAQEIALALIEAYAPYTFSSNK